MKIALINPPSPFLLDERVFPTLGVLQVAAALEAGKHEVLVVDLAGLADPRTGLLEATKGVAWDAIGLTATTPQFPAAVQIADWLKDTHAGVRTIIGGPHATVMPESCGMFDVVVRGDGEELAETALTVPRGTTLDGATNVQNGKLDWRWPARHLIDLDSYRYTLAGLKGTSMMLSQGCPYNCSFCCGRTIAYYRRVRVRDVDDVVNEMRDLKDRYGMQSVMAFDDEVNLLNEPLLEFCAKIAPLGMKFRAFVKANLFNDIQAEAMAKAGFVEVCTGVESGSNRVLGIINKQTTRDINTRFVQLARKHGMAAKAFCSLGHPGENHQSVEDLKSWLVEAHPTDFDVTVITIYPGTPIWEGRQEIGRTDDGRTVYRYVRESQRPEEHGATLFFEAVDYAREFNFYKGKPGEYVSHVWTPDLDKVALAQMRDDVEAHVRKTLAIPYPKRHSGDQFEHSMGQGLSPQDTRGREILTEVGGNGHSG